MPPRVEALVRPDLLIWGREDAGYSLEEAARKASVKPGRLEAWEKGESRPTITQLRKLAKVYRRPMAVFFLPKPPKKFQAIHDYRRLPGQVAGHESPELRFAIDRVRYRRQVALELFELLGIEPPRYDASASVSEDPEVVAARARNLLGITIEQQTAWKDQYSALNGWRGALEQNGILVFQVPEVDLEEMRGFSISEIPLPALAVNIKDAVNGRIFTCLHEMAHLMLREAGLCDLTENTLRPAAEQRIEVFCNHVAGAVLIPMEDLETDPIVGEHGRQPTWTDFELQALAKKFSVSREVVLRRLLIAGRTHRDFYQAKADQYQNEYTLREQKAEGFSPPYVMALTTAGVLFTRLVLETYHREKITSSDVSEYLDVRLKHMPRIEEALLKKTVLSGRG